MRHTGMRFVTRDWLWQCLTGKHGKKNSGIFIVKYKEYRFSLWCGEICTLCFRDQMVRRKRICNVSGTHVRLGVKRFTRSFTIRSVSSEGLGITQAKIISQGGVSRTLSTAA